MVPPAIGPEAGDTEVIRTAPDAVIAPPSPQAAKPAPPKGKIGVLVELLSRAEGARLEEMMTATGWQAHSVRGAISGAIKKNLGLTVTSQKTDGVRTYRVAAEAAE